MKLTNYFAIMLLILGTALISCDNSSNSSEEHIIVPPGKADDFLSKSAQEYVVSGTSTVTLESEYSGESYEDRLQRAKELIEYKQVVIGWFLNSYLIDKSSHNSNEEYGGFKSLVKNGAFEDLEVTEIDELNFEFKFQQIIGGTNDLLSILPTEMDGEGKRFFTLKIGKITNSEMAQLDTNHEWYRSSPWSEFNPEEVSEDRLVDQKLYIWPEVRSDDAWLDYNRLFADGKVAMGVHFGWDYHDAYHVKHAEALYNWLVNTHDFTSPVDSFEDYERTSGPLSKTITANGKEVTIEISIYYGKTGTEEICDNNFDDNGDGKIDCEDPDCELFCAPPEQCDNNTDDDLDGKIDCSDFDCIGVLACQTTSCIIYANLGSLNRGSYATSNYDTTIADNSFLTSCGGTGPD